MKVVVLSVLHGMREKRDENIHLQGGLFSCKIAHPVLRKSAELSGGTKGARYLLAGEHPLLLGLLSIPYIAVGLKELLPTQKHTDVRAARSC